MTPEPIDGPDPIDEALAELERGRQGRAVVVGVLLVALLAMVVLVLVDAGRRPSLVTWTAVAASGLLVVLYGTSVVRRERAAVRTMRALLAARAEADAERARERGLEALIAANRAIAGTLDLAEVTDRAVAAAARLTGACAVEVLLLVGDELAVIGASGDDPPPRGTRRAIDTVRREVVETGEAQLGGGAGAPQVVAPLALPDRVIGLVEVRRASPASPFTAVDRAVVTLLGEHAALALRNATRHDAARQRADAFATLVGAAVEDPSTHVRP